MAITVTTDTIVKIIVRSGTNSDRTNIILSQGELGYATDTKRLFVGDGITAGGTPTGPRNFGIVPNNSRGTLTTAQLGDICTDIDSSGITTLYSCISTNPNPITWQAVSNVTAIDNKTILYNGQGQIYLNTSYLSGGASFVNGIALVVSNSANWDAAYNAIGDVQANTIIANATNSTADAAPYQINAGTFVGRSDAPGSALQSIQIAGGTGITNTFQGNNKLSIGLSSDYQTIINNVSATAYTAQSDIAAVGQQFYTETSFVYSADLGAGTSGLTNLWQNVFANQGCQPLRLSVTAGSRDRVVYIEGRMFVRMLQTYQTSWARLATFPTLTPSYNNQTDWFFVNGSFPALTPPYTAATTSTVPNDVLDVTSWEGHDSYSQGQYIYLNSYYKIPANQTRIFGLQTFLYANGAANKYYFELNGWQTGATTNNQDGPRNLLGFTSTVKNGTPIILPAYKGIYAWGQFPKSFNNVASYNGAPGSSNTYPQQLAGIGTDPGGFANMFADSRDIYNTDGSVRQSRQWGVKNTSFIRATVIN
jgi:hypothetical protein